MILSPAKGCFLPEYITPLQYDVSEVTSSSTRFCLISGSENFAFQVIESLPPTRQFVCSLDIDQQPSERLQRLGSWFSLRHVDHGGGGVTSGIWWFGTNDQEVTTPDINRSALCLGHVLSDIKGGVPIDPPNNHEKFFDTMTYANNTRSLHVGSLLPVKAVRSKVVCIGIFSPTRWVERVLTVHELARCFDVGEISLQVFDDRPIRLVPLATLPFCLLPLADC